MCWEHVPSCPKGPASGSLQGCGEMARGAEREGEALSKCPSPIVGDVKGGNSPSLHVGIDFSRHLKMFLS